MKALSALPLLLLLLAPDAHAQEPVRPPTQPPAQGQQQNAAVPSSPLPEVEVPGPIKPPPREVRHHFSWRHPVDEVEQYRATKIVRITDTIHQSILLLNDLDHGSFILEHVTSFDDNRVTYTISDLKGEETVRASFQMPVSPSAGKGAERGQTASPALNAASTLLTLSTNGGEWLTSDAEWKDWRRIRELRHSVRRTVSYFLLEAVERMRGTVFASDDAEMFYVTVGRYLVYQDADDVPSSLEQITLPPACDFDESFGHPCSAGQKKRIATAHESGKILPRY